MLSRELWFTLAEIQRISLFRKIPAGTLYRWAHEDAWPRIEGRPVRYAYTAAEASLTRRRGAAA